MILAETDRLRIRYFTKEDVPMFAQMVADPEVMKYIGEGKTLDREQAEAYVDKCIKSGRERGWARFAVEEKSSGELIGFCGFDIYNENLDFGWRYTQEKWGMGYGTEAAKAALQLGLQKFNFPRITCIAYSENKASIRIIEKIGFDFEKKIILNGKEVVQYVKWNKNNSEGQPS